MSGVTPLQQLARQVVDENIGWITGVSLVPAGDRQAVVLLRFELPPLIVVVGLTLVTDEVVFRIKERIDEIGTSVAIAGVGA